MDPTEFAWFVEGSKSIPTESSQLPRPRYLEKNRSNLKITIILFFPPMTETSQLAM